jgi:hypothetical protein
MEDAFQEAILQAVDAATNQLDICVSSSAKSKLAAYVQARQLQIVQVQIKFRLP